MMELFEPPSTGHYEQMWVRQSSGFSGDLDNDNIISNRVGRVHYSEC